MSNFLLDTAFEFRRHKRLADKALSQLDDDAFLMVPAPGVNSVAIIVKHIAGNLRSRWTDLLDSDGEKPTRDRDNEFVITADDSRDSLMRGFADGWDTVMKTLTSLTADDLDTTITIRNEPHSVQQAIVRGLTHTAYHVGQILYLVRLFNPESAWLTIPPGESTTPRPGYRDEENQ